MPAIGTGAVVPGPCLQAHLLLLVLPTYCAAVCTEPTMLQKKLHVS
jgi:hypothetical protein